jgi:hypothetical protein
LIIDLSQELMALGVKLSVDIEDGLLTSLLIEDDGTVTGSDNLLLVLDLSN